MTDRRFNGGRKALALFLAGLFLTLPACSDDPGSSGNSRGGTGPERKNLIFITIDTLRADHLSCYGYTRIKTPVMDRLAAEGIQYLKTFSAAPWTCPSMASIFTSLYPEAHGMVLHPIRDSKKFRALSPKLTTLTEAMKRGGMETHALSEQIWCSETFGFAQGFDTFTMLEKNKRVLTDEAIKRLKIIPDDQPFFLYLHYLDPHTPYTPPEAFEIPHPDAERYAEFKKLDWDQWWQRLWSLNRSMPDIEPLLSYVISLYDGEILFVDHEIDRLMQCLDDQGLTENTVIALLADHGEAFLEHAMLHGSTLFNEEISVPMIIKVPWEPLFKGLKVDGPVSTLDLMPTLLLIMGLPIPRGIHGENILPQRNGAVEGGGRKHRFIFTESAYDTAWKKVQSERFSMIFNKDTRSCKLFDLDNDPMEQDDVLDLFPEAFQTHWDAINTWLDEERRWEKPESPTINLSDEVEKRLRGLGYIK
ncbi:MAG: sulfatase [Planctomycetota bacterium]